MPKAAGLLPLELGDAIGAAKACTRKAVRRRPLVEDATLNAQLMGVFTKFASLRGLLLMARPFLAQGTEAFPSDAAGSSETKGSSKASERGFHTRSLYSALREQPAPQPPPIPRAGAEPRPSPRRTPPSQCAQLSARAVAPRTRFSKLHRDSLKVKQSSFKNHDERLPLS